MSAASETISAFVALEPAAGLRSLILDLKQALRAAVGEQLYLADPPHLTVYLAEFPASAPLVDAWRSLAPRFQDIPLELIGWHVFQADALTGNHTLVCDLADHDKVRLRKLQREVIDQLAPLRDLPATAARLAPRFEFLSADERECVARYGFPYCGDGWQPHLTIASVRPIDWPAAWERLGPCAPQGAFHCRGAQLYRLIDGVPILHDDLNAAH